MDLEGFETYFFKSASATIIGILHDIEPHGTGSSLEDARAGRSWEDCVGGCFYVYVLGAVPGQSLKSPQEAQLSRSEQSCALFIVNQVHPLTWGQICNGGFLVPNKYRGRRIGVGLAKSYVLYAPRLGYRASVFNLVYKSAFGGYCDVQPPLLRQMSKGCCLGWRAEGYFSQPLSYPLTGSTDNAASVRLWEQLDFRRVGCIPQAGRLKSGPNGEEEYVDALVMYKAFPDPSRDPPGSPNMSAYQR